MKGNKEVIATLNTALADELTAINQYIVHSEMCADWGYGELHEAVEKRAITEMQHAEKLIGRILFLGGTPVVSQLNPMHIGAAVEQQLKHDLDAELGAVALYNKGIRQAEELADNGTRCDCSRASSRTKRITSIGSRLSSTRSSRWASRTTSLRR